MILGLAAALQACADKAEPLPRGQGADAPMRIVPELFAVHSGRSIALEVEAPLETRRRLVWSVRNAAGDILSCAGSVDARGSFTAGAALGRFYYIHARDPLDPSVSAIARAEVIANAEPDLAEGTPPSWRSQEQRLFRVRYPDGLEADEARVSEATSNAIKALDAWFAGRVQPFARHGYRLTLSLYPHSTHLASPSRTTIVTRQENGINVAELHLLAPSRHCSGRAGDPAGFGQAALEKLITHEISTLYLDVLTRDKEAGWRFFSAPSWFVQGYEEFLALALTDDQASGDSKRAGAQSRAKSNDLSLGIRTKDVYADGAEMMRFLHEAYGADAIRNVMTSDRPTFWTAMKAETGLGPVEFLERFQGWLAGQS